MSRTIIELLDALSSSDIRAAGLAGRELIERHTECQPHIEKLIDLLQLENHALAEYAWITIERMGDYCIPSLIDRLGQVTGRLRLTYLGLIASNSDFDAFMRTLPHEFEHGDLTARFFAAQCIVYRLFPIQEPSADVSRLLRESIELLLTARTDPTRQEYWRFARMALKYCQVIPADST